MFMFIEVQNRKKKLMLVVGTKVTPKLNDQKCAEKLPNSRDLRFSNAA